MRNKKTPIQLTLFEPGKTDAKMQEISRKEITLGNVIYQGTKKRRRRKKHLLVASSNGLRKRFNALDPRKHLK